MKKSIVYLVLLLSANGFSQISIPQLSVKEKVQNLIKEKVAYNHQAAPVSFLDSTYYSSWNTATSQWWSPARTVYGYNAAGKENSFVNANLSNGNWVDNNRHINYTFDANANLLGYESQNGIFSWVNAEKTTYTYDNADNQLTELVQNWDTPTSSWVNYRYTVNTYDSDHNQLTSIYQQWEANTSTWENQGKTTATYTTNHQQTNASYQSWDSNTATWENSELYTNFVYTNGDLISLEGKIYDTNTSSYITIYRVTNAYDGNHHLVNSMSQEFDFNSMAWVNSEKDDYTYDVNGNQITYLSQLWNTTTSAWENGFRQFNYYSLKYVGMNSLSKQETGINLFPNPAKEALTINSAVNITELKVIDLTGRTVLSQSHANSNSMKLDVSALPQGVYVVELRSANTTTYKKMIKE